MLFYSGESSRGLWQKVRRRNGALRSDCDGLRCGTVLPFAALAGLSQRRRIHEIGSRIGWRYANAVRVVSEVERRTCGVGFKPKANSQEPKAVSGTLLPSPHSC